MKKCIFRFLFLLLFFITAVGLQAQQGLLKFEANYAVGVPVGNLKNLVNKTSSRGWAGALMYGATDQLYVGLQAGYQDFYQKYPRQLFHEPGSDLSAVLSYSIQTFPVVAKAKYIWTQNKTVQPFAGIGLGANFISYKKYYGQFSNSETKIGFAAQPEAGIHVPIGRYKESGFNLAAGFNFMPYSFEEADGLNHIVIKAGFSFPLRD